MKLFTASVRWLSCENFVSDFTPIYDNYFCKVQEKFLFYWLSASYRVRLEKLPAF